MELVSVSGFQILDNRDCLSPHQLFNRIVGFLLQDPFCLNLQ